MATKLTNLFAKFHQDEEGLEALQVVMIIAVASMVMVAAAAVCQEIVDWMKTKWEALQGDGGEVTA